jgi:hypothetical protein
MDELEQALIDRLTKRGVDSLSIEGLLKALYKILSADSAIDPTKANEKLHYLGWGEIEVDYHVLQLALACFERREDGGSSSFGTDDSRRQAMRLREIDRTPLVAGEV